MALAVSLTAADHKSSGIRFRCFLSLRQAASQDSTSVSVGVNDLGDCFIGIPSPDMVRTIRAPQQRSYVTIWAYMTFPLGLLMTAGDIPFFLILP